MTKIEIYRLLHFAGIFTLLFAFGSLFTGKSTTKGAAIGHGIGLVLILFGGFGMQAAMKLNFDPWLIAKLVIWLIFGGCMVLAKRRVISGVGAWIIIIALALAAAYMGRAKKLPFASIPSGEPSAVVYHR
ncbi:MAG: hypothetical protein ACPG32_11160 [Akkermansiaceae bacterium]